MTAFVYHVKAADSLLEMISINRENVITIFYRKHAGTWLKMQAPGVSVKMEPYIYIHDNEAAHNGIHSAEENQKLFHHHVVHKDLAGHPRAVNVADLKYLFAQLELIRDEIINEQWISIPFSPACTRMGLTPGEFITIGQALFSDPTLVNKYDEKKHPVHFISPEEVVACIRAFIEHLQAKKKEASATAAAGATASVGTTAAAGASAATTKAVGATASVSITTAAGGTASTAAAIATAAPSENANASAKIAQALQTAQAALSDDAARPDIKTPSEGQQLLRQFVEFHMTKEGGAYLQDVHNPKEKEKAGSKTAVGYAGSEAANPINAAKASEALTAAATPIATGAQSVEAPNAATPPTQAVPTTNDGATIQVPASAHKKKKKKRK